MLNEIRRICQTFEEETIMMTEGDSFNHHQSNLELADDHSMLPKDCPPRTLSQQLMNDLAELRESTTIIDHKRDEGARYRLTHPFLEPGALVPWPPTYPPTSVKYDTYCDCLSEESSSPSLSVASEPSELANRNGYVAVAGSPNLLCDLSPRFHQVSPVFQSKAPFPARKGIHHIIGEDDPCNPFSYDLVFEEKNMRSIDTFDRKIFAPIPKLPIAAALANFEVLALEAIVPTVEGGIQEEPSSHNNDTGFSGDETSPFMFFSKETTPFLKESLQASEAVTIQQQDREHCDILYHTGPKPRMRLVDDMISLLSLESSPLKYKKMRQLWIPDD